MNNSSIFVPDLMNHRASLMGKTGEKWLAGIDQLIAEIQDAWQLKIGRQFSGSTEALVFSVTRDNNASVLKVGIPNSLCRESRALRLAQGLGYAKLMDYDSERDAILIEHLGDKLAGKSVSVNQQIEIICGTLKLAWRHIDQPYTLEAGQRRCELLSQLTSINSEAIWQWGFIEHVSCGLLDLHLGDRKAADQHFTIATRWLDSC